MGSNIVILGIGRFLGADAGFGMRVVEELHRRFRPSCPFLTTGARS